MKCKICGNETGGRPNRRYCSERCRREAERLARQARQEAKYQAFLEKLTPGEREFYEAAAATTKYLQENCQTMEEAFGRGPSEPLAS